MKILTIDTSSVTACSGVVEDDVVLSESFIDVPLTHSQTVLPMTQRVLTDAQIAFEDIDVLAVCNGPGSFTGVRIGVAAVKGLGFMHDLPTAPVSTLQALAMNFQGVPLDGVICAVMDARCRQVYTANFRVNNGEIERMTEDEAMSIDDCKERLKAIGESVIFVGDGALIVYESCKDVLSCCAAPSHLRFVRPRGMAMAAKAYLDKQDPIPSSQLQPMYLRLPQAERELKAKQQLKKS